MATNVEAIKPFRRRLYLMTLALAGLGYDFTELFAKPAEGSIADPQAAVLTVAVATGCDRPDRSP